MASALRRLVYGWSPLALLVVPALFAGAAVGVVGHSLFVWLSTWASTLVFAAGAGLCFARVRARPVERLTWAWLGVACTCWAAANLYYALLVAPALLSLPSPADIGYFGFPLAFATGLWHHTRARVGGLSGDVWLDGLIVALGTAAVTAAFVFKLVDAELGDLGAIITSLVYPFEDVALLGLLVGLGSVLGWRLNRNEALLAGAVLLITVGDVMVFPRVLSGNDAGSAWSNFGWTAGIVLVALAARQQSSPQAAPPVQARRLHAFVPVAFSVVSLAIVALNNVLSLGPVASLLAVTTLLISFARLYRSFTELRALADSRRLALTDELTSLPNRRRLLADLNRICHERTPHLLALFDLDGFKHFNDTYGHPDGDQLLFSLAHRLADAVAPAGVAYRLGGDEFCVLVGANEGGNRVIDAACLALRDDSPDWSVTASFGVVELPREAQDVSAAMRISDRRMYAQKERRPAAARQQARDVLLTALGEQQPALKAHAKDVTALAGAIARRLGMSFAAVDDVVRAAELHDVGKLAIPREILEKPGPLDDAEWEIMRTHTIIGERMLAAAPALEQIAPLVRASHERWAGGGYPDGLVGEQIPMGARIVAVCDAFDAMIADRPYRRGIAERDATVELRRCAGLQFDPAVVEAFLAELDDAAAPVPERPRKASVGELSRVR
ncbi:MAG: bifunctional diguanylate cyclase/phosphohydrolase [Solirubrobacteraceae bacterium]